MKESFSMTAILQIVVLFILLFTAIMALTINNSNAFGIKDELLSVIELNNGNYLAEGGYRLSDEMVEKLTEAAYRTTGECETGFTGFDRSGNLVNGDASICIREVNATADYDNWLTGILDPENKGMVAKDDFINGKYYQIVVFYQLDLPIIKQIYNFKSRGETKIIYSE